MQVTTTLTEYDKKEGKGQKGPWTLHIYKDALGNSYQTFEAPLSNRVYGFLNKPAVLTYEQVARGDFTNNVISDVAEDLTNPPVSVAPVAAQAPPTVLTPVSSGGDDRELRIMRQSALERAIRYHAAQDPSFTGWGLPQVYDVAEEFIHYFQTGEYPGRNVVSAREQAVIGEFDEHFGPQAA